MNGRAFDDVRFTFATTLSTPWLTRQRMSFDPPSRLYTAAMVVVNALPIVGGSLATIIDHERERFIARAAELEASLIDSAGQRAIERAVEDERRSAVVMRAVIAVGATAWEEKRRALAAAAHAAITGGDIELAESELLVEALMDLDRPHIALLALLATTVTETFLLEQVQPEAHPAAVSGLVRHGAISSHGIDGGGVAYDGGTLFGVTSFGRELLRLLEVDGL
ncbi:MAG: hypothetical protein ACR2H3_01135 [Acidimicrobiales bacterium]